jgi:anti-anti-sigma factor
MQPVVDEPTNTPSTDDDDISFRMQRDNIGTLRIFRLFGYLDEWSFPAVESALDQALRAPHPHVVVECSELVFVSASALMCLRDYAKSFHAAHGELKLAELPAEIAPLARVFGFDEKIDYPPDIAAAVHPMSSHLFGVRDEDD